MKNAKTIQIFLPDGNPRGVKIAEFTSRTIQVVAVPRSQLEFAFKRKELNNVGLYFLIGGSDSSLTKQLYVGEAEETAKRLKQHNRDKEWWTTAIVCISKTQEFTKAHVKYLEWYCHQQANKNGSYTLENGNIPPKPHLSEPVIADLMDHYSSISTLVSSLGHPFLEPDHKPKQTERLTCKGKKAVAHGEYSEDGLKVYADSLCNKEFSKTSHKYLVTYRDALIDEGILVENDPDTYRFIKAHTFNSPSQAAAVILARNANGWIEWKYPDKKTLDEVKRK